MSLLKLYKFDRIIFVLVFIITQDVKNENIKKRFYLKVKKRKTYRIWSRWMVPNMVDITIPSIRQ